MICMRFRVSLADYRGHRRLIHGLSESGSMGGGRGAALLTLNEHALGVVRIEVYGSRATMVDIAARFDRR
jgi:hypothetical protein